MVARDLDANVKILLTAAAKFVNPISLGRIPQYPRCQGPLRSIATFHARKDKSMILGLSLAQFTFLHVFLSMIGIGVGIFVIYGLLTSKRLSILTSLFFLTTALASLTGFLFPSKGFTPALSIGFLSLVFLGLAIVGLYVKKLAGSWRSTYVVSVCIAYYLNFFVLVAQAFSKIDLFHTIAPSESSPGYLISQLAVFVVFLLLTIRAVKRFHPA
jgi:hypothetical protein